MTEILTRSHSSSSRSLEATSRAVGSLAPTWCAPVLAWGARAPAPVGGLGAVVGTRGTLQQPVLLKPSTMLLLHVEMLDAGVHTPV